VLAPTAPRRADEGHAPAPGFQSCPNAWRACSARARDPSIDAAWIPASRASVDRRLRREAEKHLDRTRSMGGRAAVHRHAMLATRGSQRVHPALQRAGCRSNLAAARREWMSGRGGERLAMPPPRQGRPGANQPRPAARRSRARQPRVAARRVGSSERGKSRARAKSPRTRAPCLACRLQSPGAGGAGTSCPKFVPGSPPPAAL
jgi:hypothetical protein